MKMPLISAVAVGFLFSTVAAYAAPIPSAQTGLSQSHSNFVQVMTKKQMMAMKKKKMMMKNKPM